MLKILGKNQTWDFSEINTNGKLYSIEFNLDTDTFNCKPLNEYNLIEYWYYNHEVEVIKYLKIEDQTIFELGKITNGNCLSLDKIKQTVFPINYGYNFKDTSTFSAGVYSNNLIRNSWVDGDGILMLPQKEFNVFRVYTSDTLVENAGSFGGSWNKKTITNKYE